MWKCRGRRWGRNIMLKLIRDFNDTEIETAIKNAKDGIDTYNNIMEQFSSTDVSKDNSFKETYKIFYGMHRFCSDEFIDVYFNYLQKNKNSNPKPTFTDTLKYFYETGKRRKNGKLVYEFSFVSKLLATLDPDLPVWDQNVLSKFGKKNPVNYLPKAKRKNETTEERNKREEKAKTRRIEKAEKLYNELVEWYNKHLSSKDGNKWKNFFDEEYPNSNITSTKKIDFILWQL